MDKEASFELSNELTKKYCSENFIKNISIKDSESIRELVNAMKFSEDKEVLQEAREAFEYFIKSALESIEN